MLLPGILKPQEKRKNRMRAPCALLQENFPGYAKDPDYSLSARLCRTKVRGCCSRPSDEVNPLIWNPISELLHLTNGSRSSVIVVSGAMTYKVDLNPGESMDACKCTVHLRYGDTQNSRRAANPLGRLVEGE
ncbi:hypothetical protein TNCV_5102671 [Trichonephila clavipes]|nr:hypothetical protein TNCV_5102671 [Trichonephila clavipes]